MMTVNELSRRSDVAAHVVRYYARIGLLEPARHPENGYKLFTAKDAERLRFIHQAQALGFTLEEIRAIFASNQHGSSPCHDVREILRRRVEQKRNEIVDLIALQRRMERTLARWDAMEDQLPGDDSVCNLIESTPSAAQP